MGVQQNWRDFQKQYETVTHGVFWLQSKAWYPPGLPRFSIGLSLSEKLFPLSEHERRDKIYPILRELLSNHNALILEDIELLFLPSLEVDVPALMGSLARNRILCIVWPGRIEAGQLIYADPAHLEYRSYDFTKYVDMYVITR